MRGRQAEAARNHERLMSAAREVLAATPDAPIAQVAGRAGVGVATLYRRYASREALVAETWLQSVCELEKQARVALDRARMFPWGAFVGFMTASVASGAGALAAALAEAAVPTEDLVAAERSGPVRRTEKRPPALRAVARRARRGRGARSNPAAALSRARAAGAARAGRGAAARPTAGRRGAQGAL